MKAKFMYPKGELCEGCPWLEWDHTEGWEYDWFSCAAKKCDKERE